jgi:hypothetical protein
MRRALAGLLSVAVLGMAGSPRATSRPAAQETAAPTAAPSADQLPPALRARGAAILSERDAGKRAKLVKSLAEEEPAGAADFLVSVLDHDAAEPVRRAVVDAVSDGGGDSVRRALERHAASDPSVDVALLSLEKLRERSTAELRRTLDARLAAARETGDADEVRRLSEEDERWISLVHGATLPSFLRRPPAAFNVRPSGAPIRVAAFGDFGDGSESQRATAAALAREHGKKPFDFGLILGDNFYEEGSKSPDDPRWKTEWEDLYGGLGVPFYATLGNHDWRLPDSPAAEILYSAKSRSWVMPSPYFTFVAGDAQFFALDTNEISSRQLAWLDDALARSAARWKIVYGHHPIYSAGQHGDSQRLIDTLLPVLRNRADVYLAGHDHDMQHLKPDGGVHFFVAGAGGAHQRPIHAHPRTLFAKTDLHGFAVLEADASRLSVRFVAEDGSDLYAFTLQK